MPSRVYFVGPLGAIATYGAAGCFVLGLLLVSPYAFAQKTNKVATRDQARSCLSQEENVLALKNKTEKNIQINTSAVQEAQARSKVLDDLQAKVNREDQQQVDDFNLKTREHNEFVAKLNEQAAAMKIDTENYERDRAKFNKDCTSLIIAPADRRAIAKEKK